MRFHNATADNTKEESMDTTLETLLSRQAIADLMTGWMHRDLGHWDQLLELFHPDATIEITWFEGKFSDFVEGSKRMGDSQFKTKHFISSPVVRFSGDRALAETNAEVIGFNASLALGCVTHNRFIDRLERRDGVWKIAERRSIYDFSYFTFTSLNVQVDETELARFPREYSALAYLLDKSGFPVKRVFATKGSELETTMKRDAEQWLKG
jgi:hypothetical protein